MLFDKIKRILKARYITPFVLALCLLIASFVSVVGITSPNVVKAESVTIVNTQSVDMTGVPLFTTTYTLDDSSGNGKGTYVLDSNKKAKPSGFISTSYAGISIDALTQTGTVENAGTKNGYPAFGVKQAQKHLQQVLFFKFRLNLIRPQSQIWVPTSGKSVKIVPNMLTVLGSVQLKALVVQKSYDGNTWEFYNPVTDGISTNFHTTNFINEYKYNK